MIAVGQDIVSAPFEEFGILQKWNILQAGLDTEVKEIPGVFTGGDCATGPSTVIRAIVAGKSSRNTILMNILVTITHLLVKLLYRNQKRKYA